MTPRVLLETERLLLRAFTSDDIDLILELDSDPEVMRWINGGTPTSREFAERQIIPLFTSYDGDFGFWAAHLRSDGEFVGWFCLRRNEGEEAALGYRLLRRFWRLGLATEGSLALIELAFTKLGVRRVMAGTYEHNTASRRVMEKVAMRHVRSWRPTEEDMAAPTETYEVSSTEPWDGEDVEYAIEIDDFRRR